ncbi:hypothetical protein SPRG_11797 [Saprolegnia parasitica CBS 223.65]|uniref:B30.2/SPRY domain-containing protein n=1 Tax=Saprolegnia parasitica (strain CBS 223.65) TaxID=695850 RepID=A0A067C8S0_SAPPC|nr:hypothetical protein SPRG_11797 [Saprolegnia parasitica CBS 223.65]KDO22951.1 hypothetical protein SPRG_11797 [Saprolegnia parasitica CBS 223.65]|eukprot:XP_012206387.1 hypothetical protein SPRG_11797 [Saprolegnia parasitica CBS 223.65]
MTGDKGDDCSSAAAAKPSLSDDAPPVALYTEPTTTARSATSSPDVAATQRTTTATSSGKRAHSSMATASPTTKKPRVDGLRWSVLKCSMTTSVSNDKQTMTTKKIMSDSWNCVMAGTPADVFSIRIDAQGPDSDENTDLWVGFCKAGAFNANGDTTGRFCKLLRPSQTCGIDEMAACFADGDVLTCHYDRDASRIWFEKNGVDVGLSYDEVAPAVRYPVVVTNCDAVALTLVPSTAPAPSECTP